VASESDVRGAYGPERLAEEVDAAEAALASERARLIRAYLAGYGQAVHDARRALSGRKGPKGGWWGRRVGRRPRSS
jgi:hypothetical protein